MKRGENILLYEIFWWKINLRGADIHILLFSATLPLMSFFCCRVMMNMKWRRWGRRGGKGKGGKGRRKSTKPQSRAILSHLLRCPLQTFHYSLPSSTLCVLLVLLRVCVYVANRRTDTQRTPAFGVGSPLRKWHFLSLSLSSPYLSSLPLSLLHHVCVGVPCVSGTFSFSPSPFLFSSPILHSPLLSISPLSISSTMRVPFVLRICCVYAAYTLRTCSTI